jgi:hypothetical protein
MVMMKKTKNKNMVMMMMMTMMMWHRLCCTSIGVGERGRVGAGARAG